MLNCFRPALLLLCLVLASVARADEAQEIRAVFEGFKADLLSGDTVAAANALAPDAIDYFERLKPLAQEDATAADKLPAVDHLLVEILRRYGGGNVSHQTLAEVASAGIRARWIKLDGLQDVRLAAITVNGASATAALTVKNKPSSWAIPFLKTAKGWKIDPLAFYKIGDFILKAEIARNGFNEPKTLKGIVDSMAEKKKS